MIQFNLLPDIKLQYIKAKRIKRTVIVISFLVASSSFAIFLFLFITVRFAQKGHIGRITDDIQTAQTELEKIQDLDKVLTVQNQLTSLPSLHDGKPASGRLFKYITQITPTEVSIGKTDLDFESSTINFEGASGSLSNINKFVDTLKFTTYREVANPGDQPESQTSSKPFSEVVLSSFEVTEDEGITYVITLKFDPIIFDNNKEVKFIVDKKTTTRSETEKPNDVFKALPEPKVQAQ